MHCKSWILGLLILISCNKEKHYQDVKIIGHAANGLKIQSALFHDNTMEAVETSIEMPGCDGLEIDVQLSADQQLWLYHDPELNTETNRDGCIGNQSDAILETVRYKSIHREKLLALKKMPFQKLKGKTLMIDMRHYNACSQTVIDGAAFLQRLLEIPELYDGTIEVLLISNSESWASTFENTPFQLIYDVEFVEDAQAALSTNVFDGVMIKNARITKQQTSDLKSPGKKVIIFEVRSPKGIRDALKKLPDYLVTDDVRATIIEKY